MFTLQKQGSMSYSCSDPIQASAWLTEQGYTTEDPRSAHEYLRLRKARSLLIVYHNGTILMQGADTETPRLLLDTLLGEAVQSMPF